MLSYNEVTPRKFILMDGAPYEVLTSHVFRKQQRKPVNQTKLRNLLTGSVTERSFHQADTIEEAEISDRPVLYLYTNKGEYWFCEVHDKSKRFELPAELLGTQAQFLKPNSEVNATVFDEKIIGVSLPIKMDLLVKEAAPAVRGNTAQGATKDIVLETGATLRGVPLFINEGDLIRVNTESGEYIERVEKK